MLQNANTIEMTSELFAWENVCAYDEGFRNLMEEFPERPWGLICQQEWGLMLTDVVHDRYRHNKVNKRNGNGGHK